MTSHALVEIPHCPPSAPKAQAIVELALALPLFLLLVFGVLEFGRAFQMKVVLENAAREGAHYFIYNQDDANHSFSSTIAQIQNESKNSGVTIRSGDISVQCLTSGVVNSPPSDCPPGSTIEVIVSNQYNVSVIGFITGPLTMQSNARMMVP